MSGAVYPLLGGQLDAVDPRESVWLSASAGTGKTQVLSARVLRLLLRPDTRPEEILCLTFTKAGAAEMAVRVNDVLARWVRLPAERLGRELAHIGAPATPESLARARSLFASVLDCPGGGLRIDTIHAFAQYLLASFPEEARLAPGTRAMEDRERDLLSRQVLGEMLAEAERTGDEATLGTIADLSRRKGADTVLGWLMRCAGAHDLWTGAGAWSPPMGGRARRLLGLSAEARREDAAALCEDDSFAASELNHALAIARDWNTATGRKAADFTSHWLALDPAGRLAELDGFYGTALTKTGTPLAALVKRDPNYGDAMGAVAKSLGRVRSYCALVDLADYLAPMLELGRTFSLRWEEAKAREGLIDFDDQIRRAAQLLTQKEMAPWIRYKMDRRFDHVLIDEAQDTNADQWAIVFALIDDFYDGLAAHEGKARTIFTVGDYKQAIFGFQGTSPENFEVAKTRVAKRMGEAAVNAADLRGGPDARSLREYGLGQSFRTSAPVLDFVDKAIAAIGSEAFGLPREAEPHVGETRPGLVTLWNTVSAPEGSDDEDDEGGEQGWLSRHDRQMAERIARQVARWMKDGFPLHKGGARNAGPGDVMVLVRKRRELASLIVARLYAYGVPVAGVDRLRLGNPLAVKDLMAVLRFAAQPLDDLNLAALLVSPLIGWSQEDLLRLAYRPANVRLWEHLRTSEDAQASETAAALREILRRADYETPQALLHYVLVGPPNGRRRLIERLGREAGDPIDELLNAANAYASSHVASLQGFIQWFDAGDGELKREAGEGGDQVRVMTVHGSKGLQAPIVILADAAGRPSAPGALALREDVPGQYAPNIVPLPGLSKDQRVGLVAAAHEAAARAEMQEHWRLLYVAMTRAEEALFIGGSLSPREKGEAHEDSWYARLRPLFGEDALEDDIWGGRWEFGVKPEPVSDGASKASTLALALPEWARRPVGEEPRPPRPLAPSAMGEFEPADPPLAADRLAIAARCGVLIHALLERLPAVAADRREEAARAWLARQADDLGEDTRAEIARSALGVIAEPDFADVFGRDALAEVPFSAIVGGQVVAGTVDRLLVTPTKITVVDFKTARRPPETLADIPDATVMQMAAYVAALEAIYPGREVAAAVLYTQTPQLFPLPAEMLAAAKARFA
ncbi:double-strand break repair helicase AddA [Qipengyuania atrilutea]|uniref:DNA 3'-5' helicase n=1 Tax=Qipengyuania atrilutea TaxID=2744473 RepID=A0A850H0S4_9SPHN|nr:double-strand break repair helicase AddA [Actirhodobacter atriluteus]NVD44227.1 double-strand break repair helicase AddA [Actirhodobacter atriluteus]